MGTKRVVVVGAGMAGLVAGLELAARGVAVTVLERAEAPGGKLREVQIDGRRLDAGPSVFTMRHVFDEIFAAAGASLDEHVRLAPAERLARHAWSEHERLDLYADLARSEEAVGAFAGAAEAKRFREFAERARRIYATLERPFMRAARPSALALIRAVAPQGIGKLFAITPFETLWRALGDHFRDPRLRQLFARYSTYCGSSPFLAPATLMLIAHVELDGVWLVEGGMHRLARALAALAASRGALFRYGTHVAEVAVARGRAAGVVLASGERIEADAVVLNADVAALAAGFFGGAVAKAAPAVSRRERSLSAITWSLLARTEGFPLARHTVFFSDAYAAEFDDIFIGQRVPASPTVYVCAQDRDDRGLPAPGGEERLFCLVNAPANGDARPLAPEEVEAATQGAFGRLARCGLHVARRPEATVVTTPADFERLYPGTGGALYGRASHGWRASFDRPGSRSRVPGLYLAGGSTHPGAGLPMAALSGRLAAASVLAEA